jgi:hypothetical protein
MGNSYKEIEKRLVNIEEKLDILIQINGNHKVLNTLSTTSRSSQELARRLGLKGP